MALGLTLLYILAAYLGPATLFGPIAEFHVEIIIAVLVILTSVPNLSTARLLSVPTLAIGGVSFAVFVSLLLSGWMGSAPRGLYSFLPCIFGYFLIVINCKRTRDLRLVILALFGICAFVIAQGALAIRAGAMDSPYIYNQGNGDGSFTPRIRGLAIINDPNDFSQVLVSLVPLMFFFYRPGRAARNAVLVGLPVAILVAGLYLAHSRGAAVALMAVVLLAFRKRIGTIPAALISGVLFAGTTALSWSGGRETSVEAGSDRLDAWSTGLTLIKTHPLFGVGYERFSEFYYITAHNTIVVCAAELGIIGFFFWVLFVFTSIRGGVGLSLSGPAHVIFRGVEAEEVANQKHAGQALLLTPEQRRAAWAQKGSGEFTSPVAAEDGAEIGRLAGLMVISLAGYLVAGWFLSRAYIVTLFLYGGMVQVLLQIAQTGDFAPATTPLPRLLRWTAYLSAFLLAAVYLILRIRNALGR